MDYVLVNIGFIIFTVMIWGIVYLKIESMMED